MTTSYVESASRTTADQPRSAHSTAWPPPWLRSEGVQAADTCSVEVDRPAETANTPSVAPISGAAAHDESNGAHRVPNVLTPFDPAAADKLLAELRAEVDRVKGKFQGKLPAPMANVLADALDIAAEFLRDHEQESANGWDSMKLVRGVIRRVRRYAEVWPGLREEFTSDRRQLGHSGGMR